VIDSDGKQLGVMATMDAQRIADSKELDLVEVAPTAAPPVCRIMDYGKFKYAEKKKAQQSRKKNAASQLKEVKLGSQTSGHRADCKVGHIRDFLGDGHRVKVTVFFRGRSITHPELGRAMLDRIAQTVSDVAQVEQHARMVGGQVSIRV